MRFAFALATSLTLTSSTALADTAALSGWSGQTADFINDGDTMSHFIHTDATTTSRPVEISDSHWPELEPYADDIVAAVNLGNDTALFFLQNGEYLKYNLRKQRLIGQSREMRGGMSRLKPHAKKIKSAFKWNNDYAFIFLDDGQYLRYNTNKQRIDEGYPKKITNRNWPGLGPHAKKIDSVVSWGINKAYVFLDDGQYLLYDKYNDRVANGYPKTMSDDTWGQMGDWYAKGLKGRTKTQQLTKGSCRQLREDRYDSPRAERQFEQCRAQKRQQRRLGLKIQTIAMDYYDMKERDFHQRISRRSDSLASLDFKYEDERRLKRHHKRGMLCSTIGRLPMDVFAEIIELDLKKSELALIQKSCDLKMWK